LASAPLLPRAYGLIPPSLLCGPAGMPPMPPGFFPGLGAVAAAAAAAASSGALTIGHPHITFSQAGR
jgi:hypothetical protein